MTNRKQDLHFVFHYEIYYKEKKEIVEEMEACVLDM